MRRHGFAAKLTVFLTAAVGGVACDGVMDASQSGNLVPRTVDEDPTIPAMQLGGTKLHVETAGAAGAPVIVFLHGGPGGDSRGMMRLGERHDGYALSDDHLLVWWDQRGAGLSRRHDCGVYTLERNDADLDALVDAVSPGRPVILVGQSWGGIYAAQYIDRHPDKVAAAVLIDAGPLNGTLYESVLGALFDIDPFSEWLNDDVWDSQFLSPDDHARADFHMMLGVRDAQPRFHEDARDPPPFWRLGAVASRCVRDAGMSGGKAVYDFTKHLPAYTRRVLFVAGADDEVLGPTFQERQRAFFPASDLVTIPGAGHDVQWSNAAETVAAIRTYLAAVGGAP